VDMDSNQGLDKMHLLMSILYRPISEAKGKMYRIEPYKGTNAKLKKMPLGVALSAVDFFFDIAIQLTSVTLNSLNLTDQQQKQKRDLAKSGLGMLQSSPYRMGMLQGLTK